MKLYKLTIRPLTSFRTPLQSDTIFGHLLWALRYTEGEGALLRFLDRYRAGEPLLLVSAGFPRDTLPMPVLAPGPVGAEGKQDEEGELANLVVGAMLRKALEDERYLPIPQWQELAQNLSPRALKKQLDEARGRLRALRKTEQIHPVTRTAVDRVTGSAREGRLFVTEEIYYGPERRFDIWHKVDGADGELLGRLGAWWRWVERNGFGRRKSAGHGAFRIEGGLIEARDSLPLVTDPNGFVTLSAWVPQPRDPTRVTYRTRVKRGKLAETLAIPRPFKKPLLMLEPGAVARLEPGANPREWYGDLIEDMHWVEDGIVQHGYAFPLPVHVAEEA